jgi:hypothetical protein
MRKESETLAHTPYVVSVACYLYTHSPRNKHTEKNRCGKIDMESGGEKCEVNTLLKEFRHAYFQKGQMFGRHNHGNCVSYF